MSNTRHRLCNAAIEAPTPPVYPALAFDTNGQSLGNDNARRNIISSNPPSRDSSGENAPDKRPAVIPAKAGIHRPPPYVWGWEWIPASAGMTARGRGDDLPRLNPGVLSC